MAIANRNLAVGTKLSVRYKKTLYTAKVVAGEDGIRFRLADGREFKSPSGAGAAIKGGGKTCDGWKFWSLASDVQPAGEPRQQEKAAAPTKARKSVPVASRAATKPKATAKPKPAEPRKPKPAAKGKFKQIRRLPNQQGVPDGQVKWFCSACMDGFLADATSDPEACPQGHPREVIDDLAPVN